MPVNNLRGVAPNAHRSDLAPVKYPTGVTDISRTFLLAFTDPVYTGSVCERVRGGPFSSSHRFGQKEEEALWAMEESRVQKGPLLCSVLPVAGVANTPKGKRYNSFCFYLSRDAVKTLLHYDASANIVDNTGCYPLHLAAWSGNAEICDILLTHGPSIAKVNEQVRHEGMRIFSFFL
jgi:hypothetical protein